MVLYSFINLIRKLKLNEPKNHLTTYIQTKCLPVVKYGITKKLLVPGMKGSKMRYYFLQMKENK